MNARESIVLSHARRLAEPMKSGKKPTPEDMGRVFGSTYYFFAGGKHAEAVAALKFLEKNQAELGVTGAALREIEANAPKISRAFEHFARREGTGVMLWDVHRSLKSENPLKSLLSQKDFEEGVQKDLGAALGQPADLHIKSLFAFFQSGGEVLKKGAKFAHFDPHFHYVREALIDSFEKSGIEKNAARKIAEGYCLGWGSPRGIASAGSARTPSSTRFTERPRGAKAAGFNPRDERPATCAPGLSLCNGEATGFSPWSFT